MSTITTRDRTTIYYKDGGQGPVVTFSHGWPLNADAWVPLKAHQSGLSRSSRRSRSRPRAQQPRAKLEWPKTYQYNPVSSDQASTEADTPLAAVIEYKPGGGDHTLASLDRLRAAVVEIYTALNETLRDERNNAAECLRRAGAMLEAVEGQLTPATGALRQGLAPWQLRRVLAHIDANLETPIRNQDLAAIARLSAFHFNVAFRRSIGDSPHMHIIRRRIERAQRLMLSTDQSLSEIAAECGLADQAHLTRLFRRVVGDTPAAWRRARAEPAAVDRQATHAHCARPPAHRLLRHLSSVPTDSSDARARSLQVRASNRTA